MGKEDQSRGQRIVHSYVDIKSWLTRIPSANEVRPARCPGCGAAGRPEGAALGLWGHGLRERQIRGPLGFDEEPQTVLIQARRYQCQRCSAVLLVVPRGVLPARYYSGGAIALAMALYGVVTQTSAQVRHKVSSWSIVGAAAIDGWATLRRWVQAMQEGRLFVDVRPAPANWTTRQICERAAMTLASLGPPTMRGHPVTERAFAGGAHSSRQ